MKFHTFFAVVAVRGARPSAKADGRMGRRLRRRLPHSAKPNAARRACGEKYVRTAAFRRDFGYCGAAKSRRVGKSALLRLQCERLLRGSPPLCSANRLGSPLVGVRRGFQFPCAFSDVLSTPLWEAVRGARPSAKADGRMGRRLRRRLPHSAKPNAARRAGSPAHHV